MIFIRIAQRGEDLAAYPEVRMRHVFAFDCLRQAQSDAAEVSGFHEPAGVAKDMIETCFFRYRVVSTGDHPRLA